MIRVIYQWQVPPENILAFQQAWKQTTTHIHDTVPGARGSFLLQDHADPGKIVTIARWDALEDWQAFWKAENPPQMRRMRELGERVSVTSYEEFEDVTVQVNQHIPSPKGAKDNSPGRKPWVTIASKTKAPTGRQNYSQLNFCRPVGALSLS